MSPDALDHHSFRLLSYCRVVYSTMSWSTSETIALVTLLVAFPSSFVGAWTLVHFFRGHRGTCLSHANTLFLLLFPSHNMSPVFKPELPQAMLYLFSNDLLLSFETVDRSRSCPTPTEIFSATDPNFGFCLLRPSTA
ncbi:hypothetical protein BJY04DRAFT_178127 [Aspergillus karnatakaensis]|uniref:uncharacterized protein n=1 Tax=Aspergillus karnatakaensis TaxID=1810916 RepID=UPI003CCDFBB3